MKICFDVEAIFHVFSLAYTYDNSGNQLTLTNYSNATKKLQLDLQLIFHKHFTNICREQGTVLCLTLPHCYYKLMVRWFFMPRTARRKSKTDIYHVMIRGINQQNIFVDDEDNEKFIATLARYQKENEYEIYAYCLMGNHVHLLIKEGNEELANSMRRIGASYVYWYNWQYNRKGHLFQDRYKSEPVEDDTYFLTVLRYIHQNPVKAGLVNNITLYRWSSYMEYIREAKIVNVDFALSMFAEDRDTAIKRFKEFNMAVNDDKCLEITPEKKTISDKEIRRLVLDKFNIELAALQNEEPGIQTKVLKYVKGLEGSSLRQLSRLTGFTVNKIYRA